MLVFVEVVDADKMNAVILQFLLNTIVIAVLVGDELVDHGLDGIELFRRSHAGNIDMFDTAFDEVFDAGDADHEEFIQVRRRNGNELQLFQQRVRRNDGFAQKPVR